MKFQTTHPFVAIALVFCIALIQSLRAENRSINGSGNNLANPELGAAQTPFARIALSAYDDGIATPAVGVRNNARVISNLLCASDSDEPNAYSLSDYVWQWGQFLDHDITLSPTSDESFDIGVGRRPAQFHRRATQDQLR